MAVDAGPRGSGAGGPGGLDQEEKNRKCRSPPKKDSPSPQSKRSFKSAEMEEEDTTSQNLLARFSEVMQDQTAMGTEDGEASVEEGEAAGERTGQI